MLERVCMEDYKDVLAGKCPFGGDRIGGAQTSKPTLQDWYPNRLRVEQLHRNGPRANPLGADFDYKAAFEAIDLQALKAEIKAFLTSSVAWWPSDYGNYGPQMIRMAWHSAGTYRIADGRGGAGEAMQRFAPIDSWWDNGNTDKSRRLIWPIKQKYGAALSWADLMVLTGNCALEIMGFPTYGFAGGRHDAWEADDATYWGPEHVDMTTVKSFDEMVNRDKRWRGQNGDADYDLEQPLAASHQSLIYVNPEGPYASGDPMASAHDIRVTFTRMAMNDEETVALIAGGHAFGKSHGMVKADRIGAPPEMAPIEQMGLGWHNPEGTGAGEFTMTNGIEGSWTPDPTQWDNSYLENLFKFEWEQTRSPAGALQWTPVDKTAPHTPDAHIAGKTHPLMMMTSDIALKVDPVYRPICERFLTDFAYFTEQFSKAWYKLTHRDMGPKERYLGEERTIEDDLLWQDPIPPVDHPLVDDADIATLKQAILADGAFGVGLGLHRLFRGVDLPAQRQARRRQWRAHRARAAEGLGDQRTHPSGDRQPEARRGGICRRCDGRQGGLACRPHRARRLRRGRAGGGRGRRGDRGSVYPGPDGHDGRADRCGQLRMAAPGGRWLPQLCRSELRRGERRRPVARTAVPRPG
jgi:catalase-peroxidase